MINLLLGVIKTEVGATALLYTCSTCLAKSQNKRESRYNKRLTTHDFMATQVDFNGQYRDKMVFGVTMESSNLLSRLILCGSTRLASISASKPPARLLLYLLKSHMLLI